MTLTTAFTDPTAGISGFYYPNRLSNQQVTALGAGLCAQKAIQPFNFFPGNPFFALPAPMTRPMLDIMAKIPPPPMGRMLVVTFPPVYRTAATAGFAGVLYSTPRIFPPLLAISR